MMSFFASVKAERASGLRGSKGWLILIPFLSWNFESRTREDQNLKDLNSISWTLF